jgi:hypothetical protein
MKLADEYPARAGAQESDDESDDQSDDESDDANNDANDHETVWRARPDDEGAA